MKTIVNYAQKVKEQHALNKTLAPVETDLADASRSYAIGEQFINDGNLFKAKTPIAQHDALVLIANAVKKLAGHFGLRQCQPRMPQVFHQQD